MARLRDDRAQRPAQLAPQVPAQHNPLHYRVVIIARPLLLLLQMGLRHAGAGAAAGRRARQPAAAAELAVPAARHEPLIEAKRGNADHGAMRAAESPKRALHTAVFARSRSAQSKLGYKSLYI